MTDFLFTMLCVTAFLLAFALAFFYGRQVVGKLWSFVGRLLRRGR